MVIIFCWNIDGKLYEGNNDNNKGNIIAYYSSNIIIYNNAHANDDNE